MSLNPLYGHDPRELEALDRACLWHPFTQMAEYQPLVIVAGEGNYLIDAEGRRYLDGVASLWCNLHGHRRAELDRAVADQLARIAHSTLLGLSSPPSVELARRLADLTPGDLNHVFFSDDGSTAVEAAIKIALQFHQQKPRPEPGRTLYLSLANAYHGDTVGAVSVGGIDLFHAKYRPLLFQVGHVPTPWCYRCPFGRQRETCHLACADEMDRLVDAQSDRLAAFIIEPLVQGAAGIITQPDGYLRRVRAACDRAGCLLIADEVATGFGRTGTMFACEQEGVVPDIMCLAKGITGGYLPLAATVAGDHVYAAFLGARADRRTFFHGHTYTGNALAAAAGVASLDIFAADRVIEGLAAKTQRLAAALDALRDRPHVGDIRRRGLMVGIELVADRRNKSEYPYADAIGDKVCAAVRSHGLILRPLGDVIVLMPPLSITLDEIDFLVRATGEAIKEVTE